MPSEIEVIEDTANTTPLDPGMFAPVVLEQIEEIDERNWQQFFGLWAIEPAQAQALYQVITTSKLREHFDTRFTFQAAAGDPDSRRANELVVREGVAEISIRGALTKYGSSFNPTSTVAIRRQVRAAQNDAGVKAVLLRIDSPGGNVSGIQDLADDIRNLSTRKPTTAFIEDLGASAAYWLASQANKVIANNKTALVGSIGTFLGLYDTSGKAGQEGIRPVVIQSGPLKAAGFPGTQITPEQIEMFQTIVDSVQSEFTKGVKTGRSMTAAQVQAVTTGQIWTAPEAQSLGLIDGIQTYDASFNQLKRAPSGARTKQTQETAVMSDQETPATITALRAEFPDDPAFCLDAMEQGLTLEQAQAEYSTVAQCALDDAQKAIEAKDEEIAQKDARIAELEAEQAAPPTTKPPGVKPVPEGSGADDSMSATDEWNDKLNTALRAAGGTASRAQVVGNLVKTNKDLHSRMLEEHNAAFGRPCER